MAYIKKAVPKIMEQLAVMSSPAIIVPGIP
jgi:hypothetical protein